MIYTTVQSLAKFTAFVQLKDYRQPTKDEYVRYGREWRCHGVRVGAAFCGLAPAPGCEPHGCLEGEAEYQGHKTRILFFNATSRTVDGYLNINGI